MHVGCDMSPAGTSSIPTRPRSAALLPVSTASTGLLCLLVGAHVHVHNMQCIDCFNASVHTLYCDFS